MNREMPLPLPQTRLPAAISIEEAVTGMEKTYPDSDPVVFKQFSVDVTTTTTTTGPIRIQRKRPSSANGTSGEYKPLAKRPVKHAESVTTKLSSFYQGVRAWTRDWYNYATCEHVHVDPAEEFIRHSIENRHYEALEHIITQKSGVTTKYCALDRSAYKPRAKCYEIVDKMDDIRVNGKSLMEIVLSTRSVDALKLLLDHTTSVNARLPFSGLTPLMYAIKMHCPAEVIECLSGAGATLGRGAPEITEVLQYGENMDGDVLQALVHVAELNGPRLSDGDLKAFRFEAKSSWLPWRSVYYFIILICIERYIKIIMKLGSVDVWSFGSVNHKTIRNKEGLRRCS